MTESQLFPKCDHTRIVFKVASANLLNSEPNGHDFYKEMSKNMGELEMVKKIVLTRI